MSHIHAFSCIRTFNFFFFYIVLLVLFWLSLSLSLSLFLALVYTMALKCKSTPSQNPLRSGASTSSSSDPTPSHVLFHDEKARKDFSENFSRWGIHSECQVILSDFSDIDLLTIINNRGWESLCGTLVTCPFMIIQEFYSNMHWINIFVPYFFSRIRGMRIVVTLEIVSKVLHVPRIAHPDYPGCNHVRIMSKNELSSLFCESLSSWGNRQNTPCLAFAKGPRFLNMVMTFILHHLSHYNTITEPRARFLLSLLKDISIDFLSHFILSLIDVFRDTTTRDKLIFPFAVTWLLCHFFVSFLESPHFLVMCAINVATIWQSKAQLKLRWPRTEMATPPVSTAPSTYAPSSSTGGVTLEAIMA